MSGSLVASCTSPRQLLFGDAPILVTPSAITINGAASDSEELFQLEEDAPFDGEIAISPYIEAYPPSFDIVYYYYYYYY